MVKSTHGGGSNPYSLAKVIIATDNFKIQIGKGGFGPVYYGNLEDGQEVAIKVLDVKSSQGPSEFFNEVDVLSRVSHRNLVSLIGYCLEDNQQMLIYEYMHKGSLYDHLYGDSSTSANEQLDWTTRLHIALNASQGLEYLHSGCNPSIIHRDVKTSILHHNVYQ
jgi:serine/threonine protein kinase